jgi:MFS family permease
MSNLSGGGKSEFDAARADEPSAPGTSWWRPRWLNDNLVCLFAGRGLRSASQAYLVIVVPLYLAALGYDATYIGLMFAIVAMASAVMAALTGILSDRFGRKTMLIVISLMTALGGAVFAFSTRFVVLTIGAAVGTIGRGGGAGSAGAFGPYYPAEQPLIAEQVSDLDRTTVFGALSFVAVLGGAAGSLMAWTPRLMQHAFGWSVIEGYRALFIMTAVIGLAMVAVVIPVRESPHFGERERGAREMSPHEGIRAGRLILGLSHASWRLVWRFMVTAATNGLAIGMLGPLLVYWFYRRFGVDAAEIGELYFVLNLVAAAPYLLAGRMAARYGSVNAVVVCRAVAALLLGVMVFMPRFWLAGMVYGARMIFNTLSIPVRQSFLMGVIPPAERSAAAGMANFPSQVGSSISPYAAGYLMQQAWLELPLEIAALLQALNAALYYFFFNAVRPPEEISADTGEPL